MKQDDTEENKEGAAGAEAPALQIADSWKAHPAATVTGGSMTPVMYHNPGTDKLVSMCNMAVTRDPLAGSSGESSVTLKGTTLTLEKWNELLAPRISVFKLFDALGLVFAQKNNYRDPEGAQNTTVRLHMDDYLKLLGKETTKANRDFLRRQVKEDLDTLYKMSVEWEGDNGKKFYKCRICQEIGFVQENVIQFVFTQKLADCLVRAYAVPFPLALFGIDARNKNSYIIARKVMLTIGNHYNNTNGKSCILSIQTLLEACPTIPAYGSASVKQRGFSNEIVKPLEAAMDGISEYASWHYCKAKGELLPDEQKDPKDWHSYSNLYVNFFIRNAYHLTDPKTKKARKKAAQRKKAARETPQDPE